MAGLLAFLSLTPSLLALGQESGRRFSAIQVEKNLPEGLQLRGQLPFFTEFPFNRVELEAGTQTICSGANLTFFAILANEKNLGDSI